MTTTGYNGRLGNQFIRNIAVSLIAEKNDLQVKYASHNIINNLGIPLFCGKNVYNTTRPLTDDNFFNIYNNKNINYNLNPNNNYFQTKEITNLIYNYLHSDKLKLNIMSKNKFTERYNNNNDVFIHIRLTDAKHFNPGLVYYINALKNINYDNIFVSTDDVNDNIIKELQKIYPSIKLIINNEIETIQFASTCKHIILSHGSFSAIIGYLAFFSTIYYPEYNMSKKLWFGDMFSIPDWIKIKY